jgi:hypothetical protein
VVGVIIGRRGSKPYASTAEIAATPGMDSLVATYLDVTNSYFKLYSYATVGGYTRTIEAVVKDNSISYWRAL